MSRKKALLILEAIVKLTPILVLVAIFLVFVLLWMYGGSNQQAKNSLVSVGKTVDSMLSKNSKFEYTKLTVTFSNLNFFRGYSSIDSKPKECNGNACICAYESWEKNVAPNKPSVCYEFKNTGFYTQIMFLTAPDPTKSAGFSNPPSIQKTPPLKYPGTIPLVGYGPLNLRSRADGLFTVAEGTGYVLYVEKFVVDNVAYILMAKENSADGINSSVLERRTLLLTPCSEKSDAACVGLFKNNKVGDSICVYDKTSARCTLKQITECQLDVKLAKDQCVCGISLMNAGNYCHKLGDEYYILSFDCKEIESCHDYCKSISKNTILFDLCDVEERNICLVNPCGVENGLCRIASKDENSNCIKPQMLS